MDFENFDTDASYGFYGVDGERFKIGRHVIRVVEDPEDGYRSCLGYVEIDPTFENDRPIFFKRSVDTVKTYEVDEHDFFGYELRSVKDGHVWLRFGTDHYEDYYPCFIFEYCPRK